MVDMMQTSEDKQSGMGEGPDEGVSGSSPVESGGRFPALKLVLTYAVAGALWILCSDKLVFWLVRDPATASHLHTYKGCLFVAVTAVLLWFLTRRFLNQLRRSEAVLRESERNYREVFNATADAIFIHDAATSRILRVNQAMVRMYGYSSEPEVIGLNADDLSANDPAFSRAEAESRIRKALQEEQKMFEWRAKRRNGELFWVEVGLRRSRIVGRECVLAVVRDITDRKRAEEAQRLLATAVEQAAEAIVITNAGGTISYVNPAFEKITGYARGQVLGQNPRMLRSGKHDAAFYRQMWETIGRGEVWTGRVFNKKKNGVLYEEEMIISPVVDSAGRIVNYVAVKRDVTQEVALETQLRQAQKMEAIGQLAGGVAHDFNNILTVIQGHASLLLNPQLKPSERADCSHQIVRTAERAAGLIRQLLLFSRKQVMQPVNLNLNDVVGGMTKMLKRILGEDIALRSDLAPTLPPVFGDAGMLEQVLLNLAVNSRDAMPAGGRLTIATGMELLEERQAEQNPDALPGLHVWLAVTDTGCGIAPEILQHIFEPFFTTKDIGKGTGLGLATAYGIVRQHRGWIGVTSEINKGTTFRICLPASAGERAEDKGAPLQLQLPRGSETVLLVEDDVPVRLLVGNLLQRCGYTVLQAESGLAALDIWREHCKGIHLLLTDMVMPDGMTGRELAERLQAEKPELKVIFTSGYNADAGKGPPLIEGVNFLQKPYPSGRLAQTVRNRLDRD